MKALFLDAPRTLRLGDYEGANSNDGFAKKIAQE